MMKKPNWLPDPIRYEHNWSEFLEKVYSTFKKDFKEFPKPEYEGFIIFHDNRIIDSDKEEGFWHLITRKDKITQIRYPEIKRAEKITWIRPLIENCSENCVIKFDYKEDNGITRTYLWLKEYDFLVILEKKKKVAFLVTAYVIDKNWEREKLGKKFNKRL